MATQPDLDDDYAKDEPDLNLDDEDDQADDTSTDEAEGEEDPEDGDGSGDDDDSDTGDDGDVITFGGNQVRDEDEPEHISDLRKRYREEKRRREELEAQIAPKVEDIGAKPNLDDYWEKDDPQGEFERDLLAWNDRKAQAGKRQEQEREQQQALQTEWNADVAEFETQRAGLKVRDYDSAYDRVTGSLSDAQQAIVVQVAKNKAALVYALGKNPDRLDKLKGITNLAKFAGEVARIDMETHVSRKPATQPERTVRGNGTFNGQAKSNARMERLEREAAQTGDMSKLVAERRRLKLEKK